MHSVAGMEINLINLSKVTKRFIYKNYRHFKLAKNILQLNIQIYINVHSIYTICKIYEMC